MKTIRGLLILAGIALIAFGVVSAFGSPDFRLVNQLRFFIGGLILHDVILSAIFAAVGVAVHRFVPTRYRAIIQGALIITAAVTVVATPFVLGYGRTPDLPSALPRNYLGGYAIVLAAIWTPATALVLYREIQAPKMSHHAGASPNPDPDGS